MALGSDTGEEVDGVARSSNPEVFTLDAGPIVEAVYGPGGRREPGAGESPGSYPFTRGIHDPDARMVAPLVKAYTGFGTPEESNRRLKRLRAWGVEVIHLAVDLPSQIGYDSDHIMASGEVGRAGVAVSSLRDMEILFDDLDLTSFTRVGMLGNCTGPIALGLFIALAEKQGVGLDQFVVDLQNDPLKEYVARGTQFLPVEAALKLSCDVVEWCAAEAPDWWPLDMCVNHLNAAGAGSTAATAMALSNGICYTDELVRRGLSVDTFARRFQLFADERDDFFVAVANIRAARRIWARLMRDQYGARDPDTWALKVTAYGHGRETRVEPLNNVGRIMLGSLAYVLAGVQSLYTASFDEALATPSEESALVAVRTQQILANEQGLTLTADPLGGSYYVESLTDEIEARIVTTMDEIAQQGGALGCMESGYARQLIDDGAARRQHRYEAGTRVIVGLNRNKSEEASFNPQPTSSSDVEAAEVQRRRLLDLRRNRDSAQVSATLAAVREVATSDRNTVPAVVEAVRAYATVGEIADAFRGVYGEWRPERAYQ
jgi:methylmalonyl-CoA mutase N-terminal domain/subunit